MCPVVWDDWGGWYDHVLPWLCGPGPSGTCSGYPGPNAGGQQYVYGFRVPMLVISGYNNHAQNNGDGYTGYISGACGPGLPNRCPNEGAGLVHDFGSILNFIEYAFGTGGNFLSFSGQQYLNKGISPSYPFADVQARDTWLSGSGGCSQAVRPYSLSDFFTGNWTSSGVASFVPITSYAYPPSVFENWTYNDGNVATDPDTDAYQSR